MLRIDEDVWRDGANIALRGVKKWEHFEGERYIAVELKEEAMEREGTSKLSTVA